MIHCRKYNCGCGAHNRVIFDPPVNLNIGSPNKVGELQAMFILNYESLPNRFYLYKVYTRVTSSGAYMYFIKPKP